MKNFYLLVLLLMTAWSLQAQSDIQWQKCYGGSMQDGANKMLHTPDNGYIFAGFTFSYDGDIISSNYHGDSINDEIWVVKADSNNAVQWKKCLGGTGGETAYGITLTSDGGYVIAGTTASDNGDVTVNYGGNDAWVVKLDSAGSLKWQTSIGGPGDDEGYRVHQNRWGHYVIAGTTDSDTGMVTGNHGGFDAWAIELDSAGNFLWQQCYGGTSDDGFYDVAFDDYGHYFFSGYTASDDSEVTGNHGGYDMWVVETDSIGNLLNQKCFGGGDDDEGNAMKLLSNGNLLVGGDTYSTDGEVTNNHGGDDAWAVEVTTGLSLVWANCIGGSANDAFYDLLENTGTIILTGATNSDDGDFNLLNHGGNDAFLVSLNDSGALNAAQCYGGPSDDFGYGMDLDASGNTYVCGQSYSDSDEVSGNHGGGDVWVFKAGVATGIREINLKQVTMNIYPDPSDGNFEVQFAADQSTNGYMELINVLGETIYKQGINIQQGTNLFVIPGQSTKLNAGVYFVNINTAGSTYTRPIIIE